MKLSIVVSVFNEEAVLPIFFNTLTDVLSQHSISYELIFVNDGSRDTSREIIEKFTLQPHVKAIHFSTNFGHEAAMIAGIDHAGGDAIICMDCDMQHPPETVPLIWQRFLQGDVQIINMVSANKRKKSEFFYKLLNKISPYNLTVNASDFFLISSRVAAILRAEYRERVRFLRGFIQIIGFNKVSMPFVVKKRKGGESKYSIGKLISLSATAMATLSKLPLKAGIIMGFISGLFSIIVAVYSLIMKFIDKPVSGYTTIIVFLGLMFSIQFFILGIIGEYIGFLFDEQKKRPIYIVEKSTNI